MTSSEVRQTDLGCEQFRDDGDPQSHHEEDVGQAHLEAVGQLVGGATNLVDGKPDGEYDGSQAEDDHWKY